MENVTDTEINAMMTAGQKGGEYLEAIGKTDLTSLSQDEYMCFIDAVCTGFCEYMQQASA